MNILIDAQLPPPTLASLLIGAGHQAHYIAEVGRRDAADRAVWDQAVLEGAVIITKDEDFAFADCVHIPGQQSFGCGSAMPRTWRF